MDTFSLGFDGHELCGGQAPRSQHRDGADAAAEVERGADGRRPGGAVPGGEDIIGGEAMAVGQLENAEVTAEGVERFAGRNLRAAAECAGRNPTWNGPAAKLGFWCEL